MLADWWNFSIGPDIWWVILVKAIVVIGFLATAFAYLTLAERKVSAHIQLRIGPNRVGPFGFLQPAADGVKLFFKENTAPGTRDRLLYVVAPGLAGGAAIFAFSAIPISAVNCIGGPSIGQAGLSCPSGYALHWDIAHLNVGLLFILAVTSLGVYSLFLGGWSANSKYSLLGGLRSSAQLISYEMAVAFALIGPVILAGSLDLERIVVNQQHLWYVFQQPLAFILYFTAALAETNRAPFDLPEAEQELVAGYHTEYSSMRFGMFFMGEYINMVTVSAIATSMFLGGWLSPLPTGWIFFGYIPGFIWFLAKVSLLLFTMMWIRWTLPRLRYDRLMSLGWKALLPLGLVNIMVTGTIVALRVA
ncbi:MAG TPA: NADH-quinone oxidoreductase subunit NuoH [Candidatus Binatia bacterium]|nr:NADH-quinone oxidoreductase subunit NuoH [Candidatus Binatia bacterium]